MKERDLIGGTCELLALQRMISERCERMIVVVSAAFAQSKANQVLTSFAQSVGVDQSRRKIVPCSQELVSPDQLPLPLKYIHFLCYQRCGTFMNFWEKLRDSIQGEPTQFVINDINNPIPRYLTLTYPRIGRFLNCTCSRSQNNGRCTLAVAPGAVEFAASTAGRL